MAILRERNDLDKKWTWYLFLLANVSVLLGCAATWMMISRNNTNLSLLWLPIVICNLIAVALAVVFMWLEAKEIMPKVAHFQKKWLWWYLSALIIFVCVVLFTVLYYVFMIDGQDIHHLRNDKWVMIVYFVITGVFTLVSIGFQRYARFRIDLDVYRRKHGENPKEKEQKKSEQKESKKEAKRTAKSSGKATSGMLDEMDKK